MHKPTIVYLRESISEVDQCRQLGQVVAACGANVADLNEVDVHIVTLVIDVLKVSQDLATLLIALVI